MHSGIRQRDETHMLDFADAGVRDCVEDSVKRLDGRLDA